MDTIGHRLRALAAEHGTHPALFFGEEVVTFADLAADSRRAAAALAGLGVGKGTRVGILLPNRPDWLRVAFGAWRLGAIVVPINTLYRASELAHALRHADVTVLVAIAGFLRNDYASMLTTLCPELADAKPTAAPLASESLPALRHVVWQGDDVPPGAFAWEDFFAPSAALRSGWVTAALDSVAPADDAAIFFTSGSTADPKGVVHTHAGMLTAADNVADRLGLEATDRTYGYLPMFFNGGLVGVCLATLSRGAAVVLQDAFEPGEALRLLERHRCTTIFAWPHQVDAMLRHPDFDRAKLAIRKGTGANAPWGAALYPPGHQAVGTWGMTETGPMASSTRFDDPLEERTGGHGRPMPGLEMRIVDPQSNQPLPTGQDGELAVRGSSLMRTYYRSAPAECFDREGFFHTGDCARFDERGLLHFVGRLKDVIKTAGVNVAAAEVESVLLAHPAVKSAHVVPVPHPTRGENVAAFVVRRHADCDAETLLDHCRARLASYKVPRFVFFTSEDELPTLGSGKLDRRQLRERAAALAGPQSS
jgi:fatty-acyl-CoA synthase